MRDIKFRAWDAKKSGWLFDSPEGFSMFGEMVIMGEWAAAAWQSISNNEHNRYVLQQYTGLKDKNKKEAYEHDIYKDRFGTVSVIVFHKGAFRLKHPIDDAYALADTLNTGEVIGNIHQNPELLEQAA